MLRQFPEASRKAPLWGAFFIAGVLSLATAPVRAADCAPPGPLHEAQVAHVVDGDTLRLSDGRSVRLIGVNTPELARAGRVAEPLAEAARAQLQQLVAASGGRVRLAPGAQAYDRYGRLLAHAFGGDGGNWEARLLAEGFGYAVAIAPNTALSACLFAAERRARTAGRGVWRQPALAVGQLRAGGFARLRGMVMRVERNGGGLWLEMGALAVRVAPAWLARFDAAAVQALAGREVEVRGWVVARQRGDGEGRWLLELTDPAMLEPR